MKNFESPDTIPTRIEKEREWIELRGKVDSIVDGLGEGVDEGIKETVTALLINKFQTSASCEGHVDEIGTSHPWVVIYQPEPDDCKDDKEKREEWTKENLIQQKRMIDVLDEFYQDRETSFGDRLNLRHIGMFGGFRIQSMGGKVMQLLSPKEREQKLVEYRKEMNDFSDFLKERFLKG